MRDSSIFYRSFYEAINELPDLNKLEVYTAIFEYSLNFNEIELTGLSKTIFTLIKPNLEANNKRYLSGIIPKEKRNGSETEAKRKRTKSETEANKDKDKDKDNNEDRDIKKNKYGKNSNILLSQSEYTKLCMDYPKEKADYAIDYLSDWGLEKPSKFKEYKNHNLTLRRWVFDAIEKNKPQDSKPEIVGGVDVQKWYESSIRMIKNDNRTPKEHNQVVKQNGYDNKYLIAE